jgi:hypothetical protein
MKHPLRVLLLPALLLAACAGRERAPAFIDAAGQRQPLVLKGDGRYMLRHPVVVAEEGLAFFLRTRKGATGSELRILDPEGRMQARRSLFAAPVPLTLLVPLPRGTLIGGFALEPAAKAGEAVREAGIGESLAGFERGEKELRVGSAMRRLELGQGYAEVELDAEAFPAAAAPERWRIELEFESFGPAEWADFRRFEGGFVEAAFSRRALAVLRLSDGGRQTVLEHRALPGGQRLFLYPGSVGFAPLALSLRPGVGSFLEVSALRVEPWLTEAGADVPPGAPALRPLAADPGTVLLYDRRAWRQPDYELFAWARFPEVLILDTADYAVQDRFFKRLAFFVEKLGYRGRLVSGEEVAGLHGFNAHDYRAEDLARFYQAAASSSEPLSAEEQLLRRILIANGLLRAGGALQAGRGAILSISRGSPNTLRRLLLTHEALHGLFFTLPPYREACSAAWQAQESEEREFWRLFLRWGRYDVEDPFLSANEFQAYLLQQSRPGLGFYFRQLTAGRLERAYPQRTAWIHGFLAEQPASFERAYDRLEPVLRREARLEGGRVVELERTE